MDASYLVEPYVAIWNEPDDRKRYLRVAELWSRDGAHFTPTSEAHGHDAIAARIARAFDRFVGPGKFIFWRLGQYRYAPQYNQV